MFRNAKPFFMQVISPLHAGSGSEIGVIDLPIQRERHTGFPKIESSSLKGAIREVFEEKYEGNVDELIKIHRIFGYDDDGYNDDEIHQQVKTKFQEREEKEFAGALGFTDARLLLFPVKSMKGVYAYITCIQSLKSFKNDVTLCDGITFDNELPAARDLKAQDDQSVCLVVDEDALVIEQHVILEEYAYKVKKDERDILKALANKLAEVTHIEEIKQKLVLLSDIDFRDFVEMSTEVITRTKIDNVTGTVKSGALFTEEYLPAESVLYSLALSSPVFQKKEEKQALFGEDQPNNSYEEAGLVMRYFTDNLPEYIQIGGNATIGKGIVRATTWR